LEASDEIAAPDFVIRFPELHHYTDLNGLKGILSTNTLWATHFAHLNDRAEMRALREPMTTLLQSGVITRVRQSMLNRQAWRAFSREVDIEREVSIFVRAFFGTAFERGPTERMAQSYITSFCTHVSGSYESENGLLSQWRAYGGSNGRFCLVFDTAKVIDQLETEWNCYHYFYGKLIDVIYHTPSVPIDQLFPDLISFYTEHLASGIMQGMKRPSSEMIVEFIAAATRFKHQGFREEQEARIIVIPMPKSVSDVSRAQKAPGSERADKPVASKIRSGMSVPYLSLFEGVAKRLPIKRVIVGPALDQDTRFKDARSAVRRKYPLVRSETPFVG